MSQPDPRQFAKIVLWHLAGLRADRLELHMRLAELSAHVTGIPEEEVRIKWATKNHAVQWKLYRDAVRDAAIEGDAPVRSTEPPDTDP
jgi:hypothetical protein